MLNALGQVVRRVLISGVSVEVRTAGLPAGLYVLRAHGGRWSAAAAGGRITGHQSVRDFLPGKPHKSLLRRYAPPNAIW